MKIGNNYNQSFGLRITSNDAYKRLMKLWNTNFKPRDVEKALAKIQDCAEDSFELTLTDLEINPKTLHTGVVFSYTSEPYKNAFPTPYAIKMVKPSSKSDGAQYKLLNPKEVADDIVEGFGYFRKSIRTYLGE